MRQTSLFDILIPQEKEEACSLAGLMPTIRARMNKCAGVDVEGRKLLVDKINALAKREAVSLTAGGGKSITKDILDKWLQAHAQGHAPSLESILCFCLATGDADPIKPILNLMGLKVVSEEDLKFLDYGKDCWILKEARKRKEKSEARL